MISQIPIANLVLPKNNPRQISKDNMARLKRDIKADPDFLNKRPVLVNKKGDDLIVYAGNMRVRACLELGYDEIPCIVDEGLSEEIIKRRTLIDNQEYGTWDWDILANEWQDDIEKFDLPELNLEALGIIEGEKEYEEYTSKIRPFKQTHILLSFSPEKLIEIQSHLDLILKIDSVEYEQSSN